MLQVGRDQVLAFRLNGHHLAQRLPEGSLLVAAGACGVQNSPPGSAALALHARVDGLTPEQLDQAVDVDKRLLQSWCMRGAPYFSPPTTPRCSPWACCPKATRRASSSSWASPRASTAPPGVPAPPIS